MALAGHLDPTKAIPIAFGLGLLGTIIFYGRMSLDSVFAHWADARAEKADIGGVALMNWLPGQAFLFVASFVPVFLFALNGPSYVQDALNRLPLWTVNGLDHRRRRPPGDRHRPEHALHLPRLGDPLLLHRLHRLDGHEGLALTRGDRGPRSGPGLPAPHLRPAGRDGDPRARPGGPAERRLPKAWRAAEAAPGVRLTRGDLLRSWALWTFFAHANYNYERLQGTGFAHAMTPIIKRLYTTPDEIRAALKRHLVFFNTEPNFGNIVHGTVIAMEEQRANGAPIDDDAINSVKSGLMGPLAGIGDTLSQSTITPILLALGIGIAGGTASGSAIPTLTGATGNPLGAIIYMVLVSVVIVAIGYTAWMQGYARGRTFVTDILRSGTIDRVLVGAGVLGNMVLGALAAKFVVVNLAPTITIAGAQLNLQAAVLDPLFPGALALGLVVLTWWLLRRVNPLVLLAIFLIGSILAAYPFFGPGQKDSSDYSYQACTSSLLHPYAPCGAPPAPSAQP